MLAKSLQLDFSGNANAFAVVRLFEYWDILIELYLFQ